VAFLTAVVSWSLRNRAIVLFAVVLFTILGVRSALTLKVDAVPDITNVQVQVITSAPALSPVEVEKYVTVPIERAMAGVPGSIEIRSLSKYGISVITVVFHDGTDIYFARQLVGERMRQAQDAVPARYGKPVMGPISSGLGEIYQFAVRNERLSVMETSALLTWTIGPQLHSVPGVVDVNNFGGETKQYQIVLDPQRMRALGVSVAEVADALHRSNANAGGGYIEHNREHFVIGTEGMIGSIDDLKSVVIRAPTDGVPLTVEALAEVKFGPRLRAGAASMDGKGEVVVGVVLMLIGENARTVTEAVKAKLDSLQATLPAGTVIEAFYDRSQLVDRTTHTIGRNLVEGAALVILVLLVLLGDLRAGLVVAVTIPLSLLFAVVVMNATGVSGNLMSLGAIDFGLLVDGAVIIVENAVRRLSEQRRVFGRELSSAERIGIIESATLEVRAASIFGEAIIAIVYLPILSLVGMEGKLFRPMATTVLLALAGAFLLTLTVVPVLTSFLVKPKNGHEETWILRKIHAFYVPLLRSAMRRRWLTLGTGIALLIGGLGLFARIGAEFVPQLDEGDILVEVRRLPGVALSESVATDQRIQKALLNLPEITHVVCKTGAPALATDPMGLEQTDVYISLKERSAWRPGLSKEELAQQVSSTLQEAVPEVAGGISQPIQMRTNELVAGIRSDVAALLYGRDLDALEALGAKVARILRRVPGAADVRVEQVAGLKYLRIVPDRGKLARYGLTVADLNQTTETMSVGHEVGEVLEGERRFAIVVKTSNDYVGDLAVFRELPLKSSNGRIVPLGEVAELKLESGPAEINRASQSRRLLVEFNVRGRDLISVVEEAQVAIRDGVRLPTEYRLEWGGQFQHFSEARSRLLLVVPLSLALILFLLWLAFQSVRTALLIFLNVPFAIIGGVFALWIRDIPFSISAGVGFIALFGVAVLNGLVLVSFSRHLEQGGRPHAQAIQEAAELRLRPVLMTALVAALGFIPMALSTAPGSEVQRPLATVVIGGIITATVLTMLLLPVVYAFSGVKKVATGPSAAAPP
jgi:heavy metal efflux system protein